MNTFFIYVKIISNQFWMNFNAFIKYIKLNILSDFVLGILFLLVYFRCLQNSFILYNFYTWHYFLFAFYDFARMLHCLAIVSKNFKVYPRFCCFAVKKVHYEKRKFLIWHGFSLLPISLLQSAGTKLD